MVILAIHETPSLTQERYEQVVRRLTGKTRIESPADLPFDGLLVHAAGQGPNGFCVFDVFESEEAVERFRSAMGTIPQEVGIEEPPQFFPAHTAMSTAIQAPPTIIRVGSFLDLLTEQPWGTRRCQVRDPNDVVVAFEKCDR